MMCAITNSDILHSLTINGPDLDKVPCIVTNKWMSISESECPMKEINVF